MSKDGGAPQPFDGTPEGPGAFSAVVNRVLDKVMSLLGASRPVLPASDPIPAGEFLASHLKPVAWVAEKGPGEEGTTGRIMVSWPQSPAGSEGMIQHLPGVFTAPGRTLGPGVALVRGHAANDNTFWVGDEDFDGIGGALGRDPTVAVLADGHTVVAWISEDNIVHAAVYPPEAGRLARTAAGNAQALTAERLVLGEASKQNSRLSVAPSDTTGFLVLWATEFGFTAALIAKASLGSSEPAEAGEGDVSSSWQTIPLETVPAGLEQAATVTVVQTATAYEVTYATAGTAGDEPEVQTIKIGLPGDEQDSAAPVSVEAGVAPRAEHAAGSASSTAYVLAEAIDANAQTAETAQSGTPDLPMADPDLDPIPPESGSLEIAGPAVAQEIPDSFAAPAGDAPLVQPAAATTTKTVVDTVTGQSHQLSVTQGGGPTATLTLKTSGETPPQVITDKAIVSDPGNPHIDLAPGIATVEGKVAVVFVEAAPEAGLKQLSVAVVTPADGDTPASVQTATVTIADAPDSTISDLSVTGTSSPDSTPDLAILWVSNASSEGYGTITAQLAEIITHTSGPPAQHAAAAVELPTVDAVNEATDTPVAPDTPAVPDAPAAPEGASVVPDVPAVTPDLPVALDTPMDSPQVEILFLGKDCRDDGDDGDDEPFTLGEGRDPEATSLPNDGALAVAWIAPPEAGTHEVVKGAVLSLENGEVLQELDLSNLIPDGPSDGSGISITADDAGDIILSWLQDAIDGGFDAMAALFVRAAHDRWDEPLSAKQLKHFTEKPLEFTVEVAGGPDLSVSLTWTQSDGEHSSPAVELKADLQDGSVTVVISADSAQPDERDGDNSGSGSSCGRGSDEERSDNSGSGSSDGLSVVVQIVPAEASLAPPESSDPLHLESAGGSEASADEGAATASLEVMPPDSLEPDGTDGSDDECSTPEPGPASSISGGDSTEVSIALATGVIAACGGSSGEVRSNSGNGSQAPEESNSGSGTVSSESGGDLATVVLVDLDADTLYVATATLASVAETLPADDRQDDCNSGKGNGERTLVRDDDDNDSNSGSDKEGDEESSEEHFESANSGSGRRTDIDDNDDVAADCFVYAAGYGQDAPVPDLVLTSSGELFVEDSTPFNVVMDFDMPLSEDIFLFDDHGQPTLQHSTGWLNDLALI